MNAQEFETYRQAECYNTVAPIERSAGYALGQHDHPFDACAFITRGDITLVVDGVATTYAAGQIFRLSAGTAHHESAGPEGVSYLSARREVGAA